MGINPPLNASPFGESSILRKSQLPKKFSMAFLQADEARRLLVTFLQENPHHVRAPHVFFCFFQAAWSTQMKT